MQKVLKIAHRGASGYAPENTLAAFQKAIDIGADMIEFDVSLTRDKKLIVTHDLLVDRTTGGRGFVSDLTLEQIKKLNTGNGERVPTFEEVLDNFGQKIAMNIELKSLNIAELVIPMLKERKLVDKIVVSSFFHQEVKRVKELNNLIKTAILLTGLPSEKDLIDLIKKAKANGANLGYEFVTKEIVEVIHKNHYFVYVWIVNDPREIALMKKLGVDGIISNYPDRI